MTTQETLRAPFPWFGGKSRAAPLVWAALGDVSNYVEPFAGSLAVLLARPHAPRVETVNDADCYVANFWRALAAGLALPGPVNPERFLGLELGSGALEGAEGLEGRAELDVRASLTAELGGSEVALDRHGCGLFTHCRRERGWKCAEQKENSKARKL